MLQAFAFTLSMAAAMPAQNQAILATKLAELLANNQGFRTAKVYVGVLPPRFPITAALPRFTLIGSIVETPYQPSRMVEKPSATVDLQTHCIIDRFLRTSHESRNRTGRLPKAARAQRMASVPTYAHV